jgi:glutamyl-tRNA reductase
MQLDKFYILGVTHKDLTLKEREAFIKNGPKKIMEELLEDGIVKGYVLLETCLRVEIYMESKNIELVKEKFNIGPLFVKKSNIEAVKYLFDVVCGFNSIIKGEDSILSQVRNSFLKSMEEKHTTKTLNVIFNKAIEVGKKFRHKSQVSKNAMSLEAIALKFIREHFDTLEDKRIFIVGTGEMAVAILNIFTRNNINNIVMTNRSRTRVLELKEKYNIDIVDFNERYTEVEKSDIIISATSAPHLVLVEEKMKDLNMTKEKIFLDLAVPRDIDTSIEIYPNINLYNLDNLWDVVRKNEEKRSNLLKEYKYILEDQIKNLLKYCEYKGELKCKKS